jgi:hypothetical protein
MVGVACSSHCVVLVQVERALGVRYLGLLLSDARVAALQPIHHGVDRLGGVLAEEARGEPASRELRELVLDDVGLERNIPARVRLAESVTVLLADDLEHLDFREREWAGRARERVDDREEAPDADVPLDDLGAESTGLPETLQQQSITTQIGQKKKKTLQSD